MNHIQFISVHNFWKKLHIDLGLDDTFFLIPTFLQLTLTSQTRYFAKGSLLADSREQCDGLMVIMSGSATVELPLDSDEADEENSKQGSTLLYVLGRGWVIMRKSSSEV